MHKQDNPPDFVLLSKRKRKRHDPVDPCLGFYSLSPLRIDRDIITISKKTSESHQPPRQNRPRPSAAESSPSHIETNVNYDVTAIDPAPLVALSGHQVLLSSPSPGLGPEPIVTVEAFLRTSAGKPPTKNYGRSRKRRRVVDLDEHPDFPPCRTCSHSDSSPYLPPIETLSDSQPDDASKTLSRQRRPRKKGRRALAERLRCAAILSHGEPIESISMEPTNSLAPNRSRRSLHFVDEAKSSSSATSKRQQAWALVDPRNTVPFRQASFAYGKNHEKLESTSVPVPIKRKPLTRWTTKCDEPYPTRPELEDPKPPRKNIKNRPAPKAAPQQSSNRPALLFVPLREAETSYAPKHPNRKTPQDLPVPMTCLPLSFRPHSPETLSISRKIVQFSSPLVSATRAYKIPPIVTLAEPTSQGLTKPSDQTEPGPGPVCATSLSPTRKALSSEPNIVNSSLSGSPASVSKSSRPLRPLASFLNQFLETARLATTSSASSHAHPRPHPRLRNSIHTQKFGSTAGDHFVIKPLNTINIQSFFRGSLQSPVSSSHPPVGLRRLTTYPHPDFPSDSSGTKPQTDSTQMSPTSTDVIETLPAFDSSLVRRSVRNSGYTQLKLPISAPPSLLPPLMQDTIENPSQNALSPFLAATHVSFSPNPDREIVPALQPIPQYQILLSCDPSVSSSQLTSSFVF